MADRLQQRLVGAVVLVAVAVIFIPMLLERRMDELAPPRPEIPPSPEIPAGLDRTPAPVRPPQVAKTPPDEPEPRPQVEPPPQAAAAARAAREVPVPEAWVVQVGSFARRANAEALRDRLRKAGFTAFVEEAEEGGRTVVRVRVGPELERAEADAVRKRLAAELGLEGVVLRYRGGAAP